MTRRRARARLAVIATVRRVAVALLVVPAVAGAGAGDARPGLGLPLLDLLAGRGRRRGSFSAQGPAFLIPSDGAVEGWRFAESSQAGGPGDQPRTDPGTAFADLCAATPPEPGRKRVAVVLDAGTPADAPPGQSPPAARGTCVVADPDATGYAVLRAAASTRVEGGLVCAIDGYPAGECAVVVADADTGAPQQSPTPVDLATGQATLAAGETAGGGAAGGTVAALAVALALLVVLLTGTWLRARRRSR